MTRALSAVVLAAGHGRRFGGDKLVRTFHGAPLVSHAIGAARAAPVARIVIVKRPGAALDQICRDMAAGDARIEIVEIDSDALSASLRAGLQAVRDAAGVFVFLGDMPLVPPDIAGQLAQHLGDRFAVVPLIEGRHGHPVLLSARAAALAAELSGDHGAGGLLRRHADDVGLVETQDEGVLIDIDTIEDLERLLRGNRGPMG